MPRILRSPGSKSFRLENVSVPNADGARCERRQHPRRPKAKSALGVRRAKAALSSGCKPHPAIAPAGSNRSSHGGNEVAEYVVKDLEIGKPSNSNKCSEAADGVARESVKSCPRAGCGKSACPVVCPVKAGMFSRRQTCRGRSQSPVVWIAEVMETETLKPIDKVSPGEATSHWAVIKVKMAHQRLIAQRQIILSIAVQIAE